MSSFPKLFLDTNVLRNKDFLYWTQSNYHGTIYISTITYMEFKRQMISKGKGDKVDTLIDKMGIRIVNFDKEMAKIAAEIMAERKDACCSECGNIDWADTMIYASIGNPPTILVTDNIKDFPERAKTTKEVMAIFACKEE